MKRENVIHDNDETYPHGIVEIDGSALRERGYINSIDAKPKNDNDVLSTARLKDTISSIVDYFQKDDILREHAVLNGITLYIENAYSNRTNEFIVKRNKNLFILPDISISRLYTMVDLYMHKCFMSTDDLLNYIKHNLKRLNTVLSNDCIRLKHKIRLEFDINGDLKFRHRLYIIIDAANINLITNPLISFKRWQ